MLEHNRLIPFIFTFLPALVYALVIYFSAPYKSIGRRMSQLYFQMGMISATVTSWFLWVFPMWQMPITNNPKTAVVALAFFQVALLEEGFKFAMFKATEKYRIKNSSPAALMFYSMCVSAGFAVMENIMYLQMYGNDVLLIRAFSAILLHMITGLLMGYFLSLSRMYLNRQRLCEMFAVAVAVFYHGLYDYNLMRESITGEASTPIIWTLAPGLIVTYLMWRHLTKSELRAA